MWSQGDGPPLAIVRFPPDATHPVFVRFEGVEIEAAICTREVYASKQDLPAELWSVLGVYVLIGPSNSRGCDACVRPGMTQTRPLLERVDEHLANEDWWRRVILIRRPSRRFDNAESGYLEARLHEVCQSADQLEHPPDSKSSHYTGPSSTDAKADLDNRVLPAINVALRLGGLHLETKEQLDALKNLPPRRRADEYTDA